MAACSAIFIQTKLNYIVELLMTEIYGTCFTEL